MLLRHADLCSHGECACCEVCAVRDDMSPVMCACLRWVDQHGTWDIMYVSAVCLWGAGYVYAACVLPLFVYDTPLGVSLGGGACPSCVSLYMLWPHCVWHTMCDYVLTMCVLAICFLYTVHGLQVPPWGNVFTYMCVYALSSWLLRWAR